MRSPEKDGTSFKERIARASRESSSRIILAIDIDQPPPQHGLKRARQLLDKTVRYLCGVKISRQTVLNLGTRNTALLVKRVHDNDLPCIVDDKINDIGETNKAIADAYFRLGLDAIIANPFAGWRGGLEPLFQKAHSKGRGVILLVYMSHPGAAEGYGQRVIAGPSKKPRFQYILFAEKAVKWKADGAVVGATRPRIVKEVKAVLGGRVPIYSPGVGAQGGDLRRALEAGTDYFIIGRSITKDPRPEHAAESYASTSTE